MGKDRETERGTAMGEVGFRGVSTAQGMLVWAVCCLAQQSCLKQFETHR